MGQDEVELVKDFIKLNKLKSEIIEFDKIYSIQRILKSNMLPEKKIVKLKIYENEFDAVFIVVTPIEKEISESSIKEGIESEEIHLLDDNSSLDITGFEKDYLPLFAIYSIDFYIDESLKDLDELYCQIGEKTFLKAKMSEVIEYNYDLTFINFDKFI
ncbi:MAG: YbaK/EbsC family protein [Candidatus ainarchaeum sp.]|nr:YbaK/EbsC family protein [Candidatus ainarchaeum sp.]